MFKKLKDKLAEEVKSSPQRIQQFAQAAQAAVTSASSSISDITNSDLFSIGDNDNQQVGATGHGPMKLQASSQQNTFQDVALAEPAIATESMDHPSSHNMVDNQRIRRLSNSSFASDVSFRLPSYDGPSTMYHLQSDMEVSASEAEERGFSSGAISLDRVTKEQIYGAYRRTQDRYKKYRTQYGDLARHYKLLERENAKARSVLVETQDKALRRISELKEQCSLEQSAKAHLEKALRVEIEERNMKIDALNTKIKLLQTVPDSTDSSDKITVVQNTEVNKVINENEVPLINLSNDEQPKQTLEESAEIAALTNKLEKMEQLLNKYKESHKTSKDKNSQLTAELQILSNELDIKNEQFKTTVTKLDDAKQKIQELNALNEELQNKINTYDFSKSKEFSSLEIDLQKAQDEIVQIQSKIDVCSKREEEYAISLAENKLSIHKELESKEAEIKSLKEHLSTAKSEIQSLTIEVKDCKNYISTLEDEKSKHNNDHQEYNQSKLKIIEMENQIQDLTKKVMSLEQSKTKADEEYKCLQLQLKQETSEKLAMIDRNLYLENKNKQLSEENNKKSAQVNKLESEIEEVKNSQASQVVNEADKNQLLEELNYWKSKYEIEIQHEREELVKLQSEIEKLLSNHELIQKQHIEYSETISVIKTENAELQKELNNVNNTKTLCKELAFKVNSLKEIVCKASEETKTFKERSSNMMTTLIENLNNSLSNFMKHEIEMGTLELNEVEARYTTLQTELQKTKEHLVATSRGLNSLQEHNNHLSSTIDALVSEKELLNQEVIQLHKKYESALNDLHSLKEDNISLTAKINEINKSYSDLQATTNHEKSLQTELKKHLTSLRSEKQEISNKLVVLNDETDSVRTELHELQIKQKELLVELDSLRKENEDYLKKSKEFDNRTSYIKQLEDNIQILTEENISLKEHAEVISKTVKHLEAEIIEVRKSDFETELQNDNSGELQKTKEQLITASTEINSLQEQNKDLSLAIEALKSEEELLKQKLSSLHEEYESTLNELDCIKEENTSLTTKIKEFDKNYKDLEATTNLEKSEHTELKIHFASLRREKQEISNKLVALDDEIDTLQIKLHDLQQQHKEALVELDSLRKDNEIYLNKSKDTTTDTYVKQLEGNIQLLTEENRSLKGQAENITENVKKLESEINEVRKSHAEIEKEKDHLNESITQLENRETEKKYVQYNTDTQTDPIVVSTVETNTVEVDPHFAQKCALDQQCVVANSVTGEIAEKYMSLNSEYDTLKEENRRLKSDIEGLQNYLTKISKENSVLNDKLRELIATSEHIPDMGSDTRVEIQTCKDKINDLLRENSLLVEENLELKDQLQSQNYVNKPLICDEREDNELGTKYNKLLQANKTLELRLADLEQMSNSTSGNLQQMQNKNEKLRCTNEKLEQRLDEALVSLRHLHSLQENTELEYLRNILYEYLTGSGTHSLTLAKVLAAIVKFDDSQTQQVLQREKERQGILRQLGII